MCLRLNNRQDLLIKSVSRTRTCAEEALKLEVLLIALLIGNSN